jgi:3-hydroxyisobutyrate dehydrogenase-like beta-hydroxyacid dehydrogenase
MDIGFIGLGNMGSPMVGRLLDAGHRLIVCDLNKQAVDRLSDRGATPVATPKDVADSAAIVAVSLPSLGSPSHGCPW